MDYPIIKVFLVIYDIYIFIFICKVNIIANG